MYITASISSARGQNGKNGYRKMIFGIKHLPRNGGRFLGKNLGFFDKNVFLKLKRVTYLSESKKYNIMSRGRVAW